MILVYSSVQMYSSHKGTELDQNASTGSAFSIRYCEYCCRSSSCTCVDLSLSDASSKFHDLSGDSA